MPTPPLVSVILPTFNRAGYLRLAVDSVVGQTLEDWELIIADDGSAEETLLYLRGLKDPRVRIVWLRHSGNLSAVRNAAIFEARGTYLAFLDSDDVWMSRKLEAQVAAMQLSPRRRWSYTFNSRIDELGSLLSDEGVTPFRFLEGDITEALLTVEAALATPTVVAERSLVLEVGGFDVDQLFGEDYDLWLDPDVRSGQPLEDYFRHEQIVVTAVQTMTAYRCLRTRLNSPRTRSARSPAEMTTTSAKRA